MFFSRRCFNDGQYDMRSRFMVPFFLPERWQPWQRCPHWHTLSLCISVTIPLCCRWGVEGGKVKREVDGGGWEGEYNGGHGFRIHSWIRIALGPAVMFSPFSPKNPSTKSYLCLHYAKNLLQISSFSFSWWKDNIKSARNYWFISEPSTIISIALEIFGSFI